MDEKTWFQLRGLWTALDAKEAARKELTREIGELKKRIHLFVMSGDDPGDDGQVEMFTDETLITLTTPGGRSVTATQSEMKKALDELKRDGPPPAPEVPPG
jgi:hypothetical protein